MTTKHSFQVGNEVKIKSLQVLKQYSTSETSQWTGAFTDLTQNDSRFELADKTGVVKRIDESINTIQVSTSNGDKKAWFTPECLAKSRRSEQLPSRVPSLSRSLSNSDSKTDATQDSNTAHIAHTNPPTTPQPMESTSIPTTGEEAWKKLEIELRTALESAQQSNQELNKKLDEKEQILGVTQVELKQQTTNASSARMVLEAAQGNFAEQLNNLENQSLQITRERDELKNVVISEEVELKVAHKEIEADEGEITEYIHHTPHHHYLILSSLDHVIIMF